VSRVDRLQLEELVARRFKIAPGGYRRVARWSRANWLEHSRVDPLATTALGALVAAAAPTEMRIVGERPERYHFERQLVLEAACEEERKMATARFDALWAAVPYCGSPSARQVVLRTIGFPRELVHLADLLADAGPQVVHVEDLPAWACREGDDLVLPSAELAARARGVSCERLSDLPVWLVPKELRGYLEGGEAATIWRRILASHGPSIALLCHSGILSHRRPLPASRLEALLLLLDRLIVLDGLADADPLGGLELAARDLAVTEEAIAGLEEEIELDYLDRLANLGRVPESSEMRQAAAAATRGLGDLCESLEGAARAGVAIKAMPSVKLYVAPGGRIFEGVAPDGYYLEPELLAELIAFGCDVLADPRDAELLDAWRIAWATGCRPKESRPCREDIAPLGRHLSIYLDPGTGKTGARDLYVSAEAARVLEITADSRPSRRFVDPHPRERPRRRPRFHEDLPGSWGEDAATTLRAACRKVRGGWSEAHGGELMDRVAYMTRKFMADLLRQTCVEHPWVVTDVLGHATPVGDTTYVRVSERELSCLYGGLSEGFEALEANREHPDAIGEPKDVGR